MVLAFRTPHRSAGQAYLRDRSGYWKPPHGSPPRKIHSRFCGNLPKIRPGKTTLPSFGDRWLLPNVATGFETGAEVRWAVGLIGRPRWCLRALLDQCRIGSSWRGGSGAREGGHRPADRTDRRRPARRPKALAFGKSRRPGWEAQVYFVAGRPACFREKKEASTCGLPSVDPVCPQSG